MARNDADIWTSSDQTMWTPVKSVIQGENAGDTVLVTGIVEAGVGSLEGRVAVWVA